MPPVIGTGPGRCPPAGRVPLIPPEERHVTASRWRRGDWGGPTRVILISFPTDEGCVHNDEAAARLARQVTETLTEMLEHEACRPDGVDRFDWCSNTLDELARAVDLVGELVERSTARTLTEEDPEGVAAKARELATLIVCRRNSLLAENAAARLRRAGPVPFRRAG